MTVANSDLFRLETVWVLLDPIEGTKGSSKVISGQRRLLYAASNNKAHFTNDVRKRNALALHYLSPFDDGELQAALPHMLPKSEDFDDKTVFDWASKVGNLPRYLLRVYEFERRLKDIDVAFVCKLSPELAKNILESDGLSDGLVNLPGTLFALSAYREWDEDIGEPVEIGYDGEVGVIYTTPSLKLMNKHVFEKVTGTNRKKILSYWGILSNSERSSMGEAKEDLVWQDLQDCCLFRTWSMSSQKLAEYPTQTISVTRTGCIMADLANVFSNDNKLVRMEPGTALIDFAGPGRRVYQATVSADHSMLLAGLQKLLKAAGYMEFTGKKHMMILDPSLPKLDFYWVVPYDNFGAWKVKKCSRTVQDEQVNLALKTYVNQFVLNMDVESPSAANMEEFLRR
jgi:hypothetical protein